MSFRPTIMNLSDAYIDRWFALRKLRRALEAFRLQVRYDINHVLSTLTRRVESLNMVGAMLWPTKVPKNFKEFPISRYEWLTLSADVFLARYISVVDCAMILVNEVIECGL